jgi:hypothetical protein
MTRKDRTRAAPQLGPALLRAESCRLLPSRGGSASRKGGEAARREDQEIDASGKRGCEMALGRRRGRAAGRQRNNDRNSAAVPSGSRRGKTYDELMPILFARYLANLTVHVATSPVGSIIHRSFVAPASPDRIVF